MSVLRIRVSDVNFRTTHHGATRSRPRSWCRPNVRDPNKASPFGNFLRGARKRALGHLHFGHRLGASYQNAQATLAGASQQLQRRCRQTIRRSKCRPEPIALPGRFPADARLHWDSGETTLTARAAEQRDSQSFAARAAPTPHELALSNPYKQAAEYQQVRQKHSGSSIVIGGDAPPTGYNRGELYQTTNSAKQHELSAQLQVAHEREFTKQLMQQHGFTQQELDRGGEAAKAWVRQQLEASRRTAPASKMATGGRRPQSAAAVAASPMRFQRSGAPMLRQH